MAHTLLPWTCVKLPVTAQIDSQNATLSYAGTIPFSWNGAVMAHVQVPSAASTGKAVPVTINVGGAVSNSVTMWVR